MIPTEEEKQKIQEAQLANPDVPLGSAEQFLLTLSSISELSARLQLWAFKMDYEIVEKVGGKRGGRGGESSEALLNLSLTWLFYECVFWGKGKRVAFVSVASQETAKMILRDLFLL